MATSDIDSLLKETDQFLSQHHLGQAEASPRLNTDDDDDRDDGVAGKHVDRLLRDTDSLLRDIGQSSNVVVPPVQHDSDSDVLRSDDQSKLKSTLLSFEDSPSDSDIAILSKEVASRRSFARPSPARPSPYVDQDFSTLNRLLNRCGFSSLDRQPSPSDLSRTLLSVLTQYEVKGDLIQTLLEQQNRDQNNAGNQTEFLEAANRTLNAKLKEAERQIEALSATNRGNQETFIGESDVSTAEIRRLRAKNHSLKAKVSQAENDVRTKELALEEMQSSLMKLAAKEEFRHQREEEMFRQMFNKPPRPSSSKDSQTLEMIGAFESQRTRMQEEIDALARKCAKMSESYGGLTDSWSRKSNEDANEKLIESLSGQVSQLKTELEKRPTGRQWSENQKELKEVRAKLAEARNVSDIRQKMSTRELIGRDRDVYKLSLDKLEHIPQPICVEILQDVCRILHVDDVALVIPAIKKICKAVLKIPILQNFFRDIVHICGVVIDEDADPNSSINKILPMITSWKDDMKILAEMEAFQRDLWHKIQQRKTGLLEIPCSDSSVTPIGQRNTILSAVGELINTEIELFDSKEAFNKLGRDVKDRPDLLSNKIVHHFMQLFGVDSIEGILPAMSRTCVDLESTRNFMNAVRSTLHLESNASVSAIVSQIQRLVENIPSSSDRKEEPDFQTADTIIQLRQLLMVQSHSQMVDACRKLADRCALYDGLFPHVDHLLNRLFAILHVHHINDIVPAVQRLSQ